MPRKATKPKTPRTRGSRSRDPVACIVDDARLGFKPIKLPAGQPSDTTRHAQTYLDGSLDAVNNTLLTMHVARAVDRHITNKDTRGRIAESHADIVRSAVVFAGAGLDGALKQLIRDTLPTQIQENETARGKFEKFTDQFLEAAAAPVGRKALRDALLHPDGSRRAILDRYVESLTGGSLQSASQVNDVCAALGVDDAGIRKRLQEKGPLDEMFRARNQIVHELDITGTGRRQRSSDKLRQHAANALSVTQDIINVVARKMRTGKPQERRGSAAI